MIALSNVSVTYPGGVEALKPVSTAFERGRFTVLLGRSGAGKSTLLRCLNDLTPPSTGEVTVEGLGSLSNPATRREHRRRTGMIFQMHQLHGRYSALRNVLVGRLASFSTLRSLFPLPEADQVLALRCLDRVGLLHKALSRVDALSGGERQRVGIARALCQQPATMLADEPVASLDPSTARSVLGLLREICEADRLTAVVSLHQVDLARDYAERIIGLSAGEVVFDDTPSKLDDRALRRIYRDRVS
ncbi:MAG: phosphonate ABC transporter ATP-binding protein [Acidobacteriota bacterium]